MKFYDYYGQVHNYDLSDKINHNQGLCGEVYRCDSQWLLKKYRDHCSSDLRLSKDLYDVMKEIDSEHLVEIRDLLFQEKRESEMTPIDAYTCRYVQPYADDILLMPTDYLTYNMNELSKVFTKFSECSIRVDDVKGENAIMQKDKIVLIDIDLFYKVMMNKGELDNLNQLDLLKLFKEMLSSCVYEYEHNLAFLNSISEIFEGSSRVLDVIQKFQSYKYPVDYINEYTKNRH